MAGHRDDGTFAEDKRNHPNRRITPPQPIFPLTISIGKNKVTYPNAHDPGGYDNDPICEDCGTEVSEDRANFYLNELNGSDVRCPSCERASNDAARENAELKYRGEGSVHPFDY